MPKTVLIAENNAVHAALIKDVLETKGFDTMRAENGTEAQELVRDHSPDLVTMGIRFPDISGIDITKAIKADDELKGIPVIAVTAFASKEDEAIIREAGCSEILTKPYSIPSLLETVERYLGDPV